MDYFEAYKDKKNIVRVRKQMVEYAMEHGIKPAAREFSTTVKTVKKWMGRFREASDEGLTCKLRNKQEKK